MTRTDSTPATARYDWIASLAFWLCLVVAAALFASVTLAPRLVTYLELRKEYQANQEQLVGLEGRTQYLEKVVDALRSDAQFAAEVARIDFDAARPGDERIAVDKSLSLSIPRYDPPPAAAAADAPWYVPATRFLAGNPSLRPLMLAVAAALVVVAFTYLHDTVTDEPEEAAPSRRSRRTTA